MKKVVLAYSGGLASSVAIPWLKQQGHAGVIAVTLDLGQRGELNQIRERAMSAGAVRCHVLDVREEFVRNYLLPALQAGAIQKRCPLGKALESPLIAKKLIEIARMEDAPAVAHGATGKGNDPSRLDVAVAALDPAMTVIAAAGVGGMTPQEQIEYARDRSLAVPVTRVGALRIGQNLWGRSIECGPLVDLWNEPPEDLYTLTKSPEQGPGVPAYVEIEWEAGVPVSVNGVAMPLTELIDSLETIAGAHGVGRVDIRLAGIGSREVYEAPAGTVLHAAHTALERLVMSNDLQRVKRRLAGDYADIAARGSWFSPAREALDAFVQRAQQRVTGVVRMKLYKGGCRVVGLKSDFALHDHARAARGDARHAAPAVK